MSAVPNPGLDGYLDLPLPSTVGAWVHDMVTFSAVAAVGVSMYVVLVWTGLTLWGAVRRLGPWASAPGHPDGDPPAPSLPLAVAPTERTLL